MTISDRERQPKNARSPMLVTLEGITISDRESQLENALSPMLVTLEGMTIFDREIQEQYLLLVDYQYYTL